MLTLKKLARLLIESGRCTLMPTGVGRMLRRGGAPKPTLDLDFTRGTMPSGLTFSRSSNATRVGPTGLLEWAPHNLMPNSEFVGASVGNPGSMGSGWTTLGSTVGINRQVVATGVQDGRAYADVRFSGTATGSGAIAVGTGSNLSVSIGQIFTGSFWLALVGGSWPSMGVFIRITERTSGGSVLASSQTDIRSTVTNSTPVRISLTRTLNQATVAQMDNVLRIDVVSGDVVDFTVRVSGWQIEQGAAASGYNPSPSGGAYYGPRFDYDPTTLACRGLLIEEARTNLNTASNSWALTSSVATISQNAQGADGVSNTGWTLTESGSSGVQRAVAATISFTSGTTYTMFALVKPGTATRVQVAGPAAAFSSTTYANFSLSGAGSVLATGAGVTATAPRLLANGYWLCAITAVAAATTTGEAVQVAHINSDTATRMPSYAGSGLTLLLHHGQCEAGSFPTSIIPTFGASATRAADSLTSTLGSWFNPLQGTLYAEGDNAISAAGAGSICDVGFDDGTANNRIYLRSLVTSGNTQGTIVSGGTVLTNLNAGSNLGYFVRKKSAFGFVAGRQTVVQDGAIVAQSSVALPAGLNRLTIAQGASSAAKNARISRVTYYPVALPGAALQALTR